MEAMEDSDSLVNSEEGVSGSDDMSERIEGDEEGLEAEEVIEEESSEEKSS